MSTSSQPCPSTQSPRTVGCADASLNAQRPEANQLPAASTPDPQARTSAPDRRPRAHSPARASHGDRSGKVDGRDGVRAPLDGGQDQRQRGGRHELRHHQAVPPRSQGQDDPGHEEPEADHAEQLLGRQVTEPAGVVGAHDVEHDEAEGDGGQGLGGDLETPAAEQAARRAGGGGEEHEDGRAAADAEPRPGHGQEDHRRDQEARRAEAQQDLGDRRALEPAARRDGRLTRASRGGRVETGNGGRVGGGQGSDGSDGGGAEPVEEVVGLAQGAEQLGGEESPERQGAGRATER